MDRSTRVLLAEDDENMRKGLTELLTLEGFECEGTANGELALGVFNQRRPDLLILDIMMPTLDGLSLCRTIRERDPAVPILMLSARDTVGDRVVGLEQGADDYLVKPFSPRELVARIHSLLRRTREAASSVSETAVFRLHDLEVDSRALRAKRGDLVIDLTTRDVQLLRLLHRRRGEAVSRNDLLDECWGQDHLPNSRALDQYISTLRRKIEQTPSVPRIISTVYGYGYRYDD